MTREENKARAAIVAIDRAIEWQESIKRQTKDPTQRRRVEERILRLMRERMEESKILSEAAEDRGVREQAAWTDTSKELG